jgi:hypothetical protein
MQKRTLFTFEILICKMPLQTRIKHKVTGILCFCCTILNFYSFGQYEKPTLGVEIKPIIPSDLFAVKNKDLVYKDKTFSINPQIGVSAGAVVRLNLSKFWNLESGIYYTERVYGTRMRDSMGTDIKDKFRFDNYEIPISALVYIRLAKNIYLNTSFGLSLDFFPTDVQSPDNGMYVQKAYRSYWVLPALLANVGAEFRTKNSGYFYIGGLYHRMLYTPMGAAKFSFDDNGYPDQTGLIPLQGHYFSIDFKYFFPTNRTPTINNGT